MSAPWEGIPPCPHMHEHMPNSPQCVSCWNKRHADAEILMPVAVTLARLEALPFDGVVHDEAWSDSLEACKESEAQS